MKTAGASEKAPPFHKTKPKGWATPEKGQSQNRISVLRMVHRRNRKGGPPWKSAKSKSYRRVRDGSPADPPYRAVDHSCQCLRYLFGSDVKSSMFGRQSACPVISASPATL